MATSLFPAPPLACLDPKCPANDTTVAASFTGRSFYYRRSPCCLSIQEPPDAPADNRVEVVALRQALRELGIGIRKALLQHAGDLAEHEGRQHAQDERDQGLGHVPESCREGGRG